MGASHQNSLMINEKINNTRETLMTDVDALKRDAGQIVADVKNHAQAHVDVVKDEVRDTFDRALDYVKERPFHVAAVSLFVGFLVGAFRRK